MTSVLSDEPPEEFRIFRAGVNDSTKGPVLFDEQAAASVMAAWKKWGVDLMIDLEHQALDADERARADAPDARGWFRLEVREGELWAVGVRWTPDGARRLREKTQRYISPAFHVDDDDRVTELVNVALVAMPATHHAAPLVASRDTRKRKTLAALTACATVLSANMDPEQVKAALAAIKEGDADKALELLESMVASAAGAAPEGDEGGGPDDALAEDPEEDPEEERAEDPEDPEEDPEEAKALAKQLRRLGFKPGETVREIKRLRAIVDEITAERAKLDMAARREQIAELVKLGAETPATAWQGDPKDRKPAKHLAAMPLDDLRARVQAFRAARPHGVRPPERVEGDEPDVSTLTDRERELCAQRGIDPKDFIRRKRAAARRSA